MNCWWCQKAMKTCESADPSGVFVVHPLCKGAATLYLLARGILKSDV